MTHHDDLDRELASWLSDEAARRAPTGLIGAIATASRTRRQQPGWLVALRGESMGAGAVTPTRTRRIALVAIVAVLAALLAIVIAGQQRNPFGTGMLAFVRNGDVYLAEPDGSNARVALHQGGFAFATVAWSPDGARLAIDGESGVVVLEISTGKATNLGGSNPVWSPDGHELAVLDVWSAIPERDLRIVDAASLSTRATYPFPANSGLAWSPNGRWVAATGGDASKSVVRIDASTGEVIQIEGPSGHLDAAREVSWSPDSLRVAFVRYGNTSGPACGDTLACRIDVVVANADGTDPVIVNSAAGQADMPSWSPDGRWLAFRSTIARTVRIESVNASSTDLGGAGIQVVRADGTDERTILAAPVDGLAWSRNGTSLLFIVRDASSETIWETSLGGVAHSLDLQVDNGYRVGRTGLDFARQVADAEALPPLPDAVPPSPAPTLQVVAPAAADPADPAGTWPTLMAESDEGCTVKRIATATGVAAMAVDACDPTASDSSAGPLSPTGEFVAGSRDGHLSIVSTDTASRLEVPALAGMSDIAWSPDGMWLWVRDLASYLLRPDGSRLHTIPGTPSWSPDGHTIAIATADGALSIGGPDGPDFASIGTFPAPVTWAPDERRFGFIRGGDLWTAAVDGSELSNVTNFPHGGTTGAAWSPSGEWIVVEGAHGLWLFAVDGSLRRSLDFGLLETTYEVTWSPDSTRVAVQLDEATTGQGLRQFIDLVKVDGSPTIRIDDATAATWSPDGRYLVVINTNFGDGGWQPGNLSVMNADGSGRHDLGTIKVVGPLVWLP